MLISGSYGVDIALYDGSFYKEIIGPHKRAFHTSSLFQSTWYKVKLKRQTQPHLVGSIQCLALFLTNEIISLSPIT